MAYRQQTLWTLTGDGEASATSGTLSVGTYGIGGTTVELKPGATSEFTLRFGYDMNGDGILSDSNEKLRVVYVKIISLAELTGRNNNKTTETATAKLNPRAVDLNITPNSSGGATLGLIAKVMPGGTVAAGSYPLALYRVADREGTEIATGSFVAYNNIQQVALNASAVSNFVVTAGLDLNGNGELDDGTVEGKPDEISQTINGAVGPYLSSMTVTNADTYGETQTVTSRSGSSETLELTWNGLGTTQVNVHGTLSSTVGGYNPVFGVFAGSTKIADVIGGSTLLDWNGADEYVIKGGVDMNRNNMLDAAETQLAEKVKPKAAYTIELHPAEVDIDKGGTKDVVVIVKRLGEKVANKNVKVLEKSIYVTFSAPKQNEDGSFTFVVKNVGGTVHELTQNFTICLTDDESVKAVLEVTAK